MSDFGFKMSKEGESVLTAGEKDLDFNSNRPLLKKKMKGIASVEVTESNYNEVEASLDVSITITHSLGYKPRVFAKMSIGSGAEGSDEGFFRPMPFYEGSAGGVIDYGAGYTQGENTLVLWANGWGWWGITIGEYINFKYEIFYNT